MGKKKNPPTPEEIQRKRDEYHQKIKNEGTTMSEKEWNKLMNYYDDKKNMDERFERMDLEKLKKAMNRKSE